MIQEDYCSYELSQLLKEKGFEGICEYAYSNKGNYFEVDRSNFDEVYCLRPTHQSAMKWLREVHKLFVEISVSVDLNGNYHYSYTILDRECKYIRRGYTDFDWDYKQAVESALKYSLENLI